MLHKGAVEDLNEPLDVPFLSKLGHVWQTGITQKPLQRGIAESLSHKLANFL